MAGRHPYISNCPETAKIPSGEILLKVGPEGNCDHSSWNDADKGNVKQIYITLCESESIILVSGFLDLVDGETVISSIKISTDSAEYGPYGSEKEVNLRSAFMFEVEASKFAGFHGYSNCECAYAMEIYVNTKARSALGTEASNLPRLTC
ncbi:hypothetical protein NE237_014098 [Protea cynaroides]|uniref:Jacalin-type lectin domain-containing protein n=1 Tax=Protea cynaroides TaxID=273540 RepID=A0A9Q0H148_9MAGN|nr:hypothetical protein NE237_014098 [Protea cynaroides]